MVLTTSNQIQPNNLRLNFFFMKPCLYDNVLSDSNFRFKLHNSRNFKSRLSHID